MAISPIQASVIQKELIDLLLLLQTLSSPQLRALCQFVQNYVLQDTTWVKALMPVLQRCSVDRIDKLIALVNSSNQQIEMQQHQLLRQELESVSQEFQIPARELENGFGILLQLYQLFNMLQNLSIIQLMKLFEVVPQAPPIQQLQLLQQIQQLFGMLKGDALQNIHKAVYNLPPGQDQITLKQMLNLPNEYFQLYQPLRVLLQLDFDELNKLQEVIPKLNQTQMLQLLQMLQLQPMDVLELRTMFHLDKGITDDLLSFDDSLDMDIPMEPDIMQFQQPQLDKAIRLQIVEQPPEKSVYKRNLKPNPVVMLVGDQKMNDGNLYIVPTLIRTDTFQEEAKFITGNKPVRVTSGRIIPFKKLKITTTSHQQGETLFCVRFELRRYAAEDQYEVLDTVHSNPISVLSHSTQMKPAPAQAPTINEIIPESGPTTGGTRVAIIGSNFIDSPAVRIKFDNVEVMPQFHGTGTLVCHSPQHPPGTVVVRVCNANKKWSETSANFTFYDENSQDRYLATSVASNNVQNNMPPGVHEAAFQGNYDQLTRLHMNGSNLNSIDQRSFTALQYAISSNQLKIANYLLENGADANYQDRFGSTALHWATMEGNEAMVQLLVENGANMNIPNYEGETPLSLAVRNQYERIASYLMENGAIINTSSIDGHSPLHIASALGNVNLINILIQKGAFVNAVDFCNETPLHWAVRENQLEAVSQLLVQRARLDIQNEDHETPLMLSVYLNHEAVAAELIQRGASINVKDAEGWTILHEAVVNGSATVAKMLAQKGADIFARNSEDLTPYKLAVQNKQLDIVGFFSHQFGGNHQQLSEIAMAPKQENRGLNIVSMIKEEPSLFISKASMLNHVPLGAPTSTV